MIDFLTNFGNAMVELNSKVPGNVGNRGNNFKPGIGPYGENKIVDMVMERIGNLYPDFVIRPGAEKRKALGMEAYKGPDGGNATPDLFLNGKIIEFKIIRPLRDNGEIENSWMLKFDPHPGSYSCFIDVEKFHRFDQKVQGNNFEKWIVIIGFERENEPTYKLDRLFPALYTFISENILGRKINTFIQSTHLLGKKHPYHQVLKLYAFRY